MTGQDSFRPTGPPLPLTSLPTMQAADIINGGMANGVATTGNQLGSLVWRGNGLTILTLGLYRFWYKTDLRRWYWGNTLVGGDGLEYRGTAREKLLGFLYALAVVLPLYFFGAMIGLFAGEFVGNAVSGVSIGLIGLLIQYGAYRSRRYRLTRTVWRSVRFDQVGSAWAYAFRSARWVMLTLFTLGLAFPAMRRSLEEYRISHTRFGSAEGVFMARTGPLMKRWLVLWLGPMLLLLMAGILGVSESSSVLAVFLAVIALQWPVVLWPWYRAAEFRHFTDHTSLGPVSFESSFDTRAYYRQYLIFCGLMLLVIMGLLLAAVMLAPSITSFEPEQIQIILFVVGAIVYLGVFFVGSSLKELILNQGFWRIAVGRLVVHNLDQAGSILGNSVSDEAATGEGLADALDFGGI